MNIDSLLASAEREAEAASRAFGSAPTGGQSSLPRSSASTAATLGVAAGKNGPPRAGHHALALTAIEGADSDDDNELFDEFSCGDLYSFGQTEQQTQSNEKPAGGVPTAAAALSPPPPPRPVPVTSAAGPEPSHHTGKAGSAPASGPLDAPSSIDRPGPVTAPRLSEDVAASAKDDVSLAINERSELPAPLQLHTEHQHQPTGTSTAANNDAAAAAVMDEPVLGACSEDREAEVPAADTVMMGGSNKELEREHDESKEQSLEHHPVDGMLDDAPMAENLDDGVAEEEEECREEQEQEDHEEEEQVPSPTHSTEPVLPPPSKHHHSSKVAGHVEPYLLLQQQQQQQQGPGPQDWQRTGGSGGRDDTPLGGPFVPPLQQRVSINAPGAVNHHEDQSRAHGRPETPVSSECGHGGAVAHPQPHQSPEPQPSEMPLSLSATEAPPSVDDGTAEPLQRSRPSSAGPHKLPGLHRSSAQQVCQASVEPRPPVPERSPQQQQGSAPPPPSWAASEALPGQGGMPEEGPHQAKTGGKTPSSPPPASTSARGRHHLAAARHNSRPPLIPQHQAARPPAPKRPRSPEYQDLQQHQPRQHRNPQQLPTMRLDETMPPPAAPTAADVPRSTGPNTGISDAPLAPPNAPSGLTTDAADVPGPRGSVPPHPCSPRSPPSLSHPPEPRLTGPGSGSRASGAVMPLPLTQQRSQQKPAAAPRSSPAQQLPSPCEDASLLSLGAPRNDASPLCRRDGASIQTVTDKAMKLTRKIDQMLLECQDQHDRCLETCVKLAITRNLQARLFSPVVLGELMEVEERARKAGLLPAHEETAE